MKTISKSNYIKVAILFIVTILVVFVLADNYTNKEKYDRVNDDIMNFLSVVKYEELENYLVENHDGFIYMAPSIDSSLDTLEKDLKKYILDEELEKQFVYLDSSDYSSEIYSEIKNRYFSESLSNMGVELSSIPTILAVKDEKVIAVLSDDVTLEKIKAFVNSHEVVE